jgi:ferric-dicitrate binding protein FerR (iron transport regulator)
MAGTKPSVSGALPADSLEQRHLSIQSIKPVEIHSQQYIEETSWLDNKLVFKNETFEELAPRLERWFNVSIHVNNGGMNTSHFTGIFQNESLDQALRAMQLIKPFKYKISNDEVIID